MARRTASSQVAWSLLAEGVSGARVDVHRLQQILTRAEKLVADSSHREHIHQVAGDIIREIPARVQHLERLLDRTSYALSLMGEEFFKNKIPHEDRSQVDDAVDSISLGTAVAAKVARRHLDGDQGQ